MMSGLILPPGVKGSDDKEIVLPAIVYFASHAINSKSTIPPEFLLPGMSTITFVIAPGKENSICFDVPMNDDGQLTKSMQHISDTAQTPNETPIVCKCGSKELEISIINKQEISSIKCHCARCNIDFNIDLIASSHESGQNKG